MQSLSPTDCEQRVIRLCAKSELSYCEQILSSQIVSKVRVLRIVCVFGADKKACDLQIRITVNNVEFHKKLRGSD